MVRATRAISDQNVYLILDDVIAHQIGTDVTASPRVSGPPSTVALR